MELELAYRPTGKQLAFHASTADEVLYGGAAGTRIYSGEPIPNWK